MNLRNRYQLLIVMLIMSLLSPMALSAQANNVAQDNFTVTFSGSEYSADADTTTFTYVVAGTGTPPDLSHFNIAIPVCDTALEVVSFAPVSGVEFGTDPITGVSGIKWDVRLLTTDTRTYSVTFAGEVLVGAGLAAVKGGPGFYTVDVPGPVCEVPALGVSKFISTDGSAWVAANVAPGLVVDLEDEVFFRFVVENVGKETLTDITLTDSVYDASTCEIPEELAPGETFECVIGGFPAEEGQHSNVVTVTALAGEEEVSAEAFGFYFGGELEDAELPITIVIEGPVSAIIGNVIVIFGVQIELSPDDPLLLTIRIGDIIRVEGENIGDGTTIVIIAVVVVIVQPIVVIEAPGTGGTWTDVGNCRNPPPPWAPAHGWRARCEGRGRR